MKKILIFCILTALSLPVFGTTLRGGYPVCTTKKMYEQFIKAYMRDDKKECGYLLGNGCFLLAGGMNITILDQSTWSNIAKIRVFAGTDTIIMWTHIKNTYGKKKAALR